MNNKEELKSPEMNNKEELKEPDWKVRCIELEHEKWILQRKVEALEYLIYNCIPKDDRRKYYN